MKRRRKLIAVLIMGIFIFNSAGCSNTGSEIFETDNIFIDDKDIDNKRPFPDTGLTDGLFSGSENSHREITVEDMVAATTSFPSYGIDWNVPDLMEYNGGEITTEVTITNGSFKIEKGFSVSLNGVLQECVIEDEGVKSEKTLMPEAIYEKDEKRTVKISFTPNTGLKGDVLDMALVHTYMPDFIVDDKMENLFYGNEVSMLTVANIFLTMNADSSQTADITDTFSGLKKDKIDPVLYDLRTFRIDEYGNRVKYSDTDSINWIEIYNKGEDRFIYSGNKSRPDGIDDKLTAKAEKEVPMTVCLYGKPGRRRVSLFVNNEIQNCFDGKSYIDVEISEGEQAELSVLLDLSGITGYNNIYALSKELDSEKVPGQHLLRQSEVYVLKVG